MAREELRDALGVGGVPVHPDAEGPDAAQRQPSVERAADRPHGVLVERQFSAQAHVRDDQRSTDLSSAAVGLIALPLGFAMYAIENKKAHQVWVAPTVDARQVGVTLGGGF